MGTWNASINGNDTAQDLKSEYQATFLYNDVEKALAKIDSYVRRTFDESDEEEWANYYYSLADFMWKCGILTDAVRNQAIGMIDSGFGLDIWAAEGNGVLNKRKKVLAEFREKLLSPQPPKKKIRLSIHMKPIFQTGDLIALQLKTLDKHYPVHSQLGEQNFRNYDGKYIVLRKVGDKVSQYSYIEPELKDYWAMFQLYNKIFDECPVAEQLKNVPYVPTRDNTTFTSESSLFHFKKRNFRVIGNNQDDLPEISNRNGLSFVFWGIDTQWGNPESDILRAILSDSILD
ncbi:MAG: hypothetical protein IJ001_04920 [Oscillospiraceae bacterium]|nr:hypothetical protein [Oscillospiraceae bacterium]